MGGLLDGSGVRMKAPRTTRAVVLGAVALIAVPTIGFAQEEAPETEILESARQAATHTVKRGDTLWDLAGFYLSDHFRWPAIYEINTSIIEDPHWIYPGEILTLPAAAAVADQLRNAPLPESLWDDAARGEAGVRRNPGDGVSWFGGPSIFDQSPDVQNILVGLDIEAYGAPALVSANDFFRAPMLVDKRDYPAYGRIVRKIESNPLGMKIPPTLRRNDIVVIQLEGLSIRPGDRLRGIRWHGGVRGLEIAESMALLEVTEADEEWARARVTEIFGGFSTEDPVIPAETYSVPETLGQAPVEDGMHVELIAAEVDQVLLSQGDMVFLDAGADEGVMIGDEFAVFDRRDGADARLQDRLATVRVVRVEATTSTARIVNLKDASPKKGSPGRRIYRAVAN